MLSKKLRDLETLQLVKRTVYDPFPPSIEYSIVYASRSGCWSMFCEVMEREYSDFRYASGHHFTVDE